MKDWINEQEQRIAEFLLVVEDMMAMRRYRGTKDHDRRMEQLRKRVEDL